MTVYNFTITEAVNLAAGNVGGDAIYSEAVATSLTINDLIKGTYKLNIIVSFSINDVASYLWKAGANVVEGVGIGGNPTPHFSYHLGLVSRVAMGDKPNVSFLAILREGIDFDSDLSNAWALSILEKVRARSLLSTQGSYNVYVVEQAALITTFAHAVGASLQESAGIASSLAAKYIAHAAIQQALEINSDANTYTHMVYHPSVDERLDITDVQIVKMIYDGQVAEGVDIFLLYGAPVNGDVTAWAMNTRNAALTEYKNWKFNSFALMGRKYIGADQSGLYELNGPTDAGQSTTADIAGGFLEMGDGKLAGLKGVYLGLDGQGTYFLRLDAGNGDFYLYQFVSQPNLMTTKVIVGKGIRTRWLRWELITTGPDFDLASIEFVPMISGRRV